MRELNESRNRRIGIRIVRNRMWRTQQERRRDGGGDEDRGRDAADDCPHPGG